MDERGGREKERRGEGEKSGIRAREKSADVSSGKVKIGIKKHLI